MARPTLFTPERTRKIVELISAGNNQETAAAAAGVSAATLYNWLQRGRLEQERLDANPKLKPRKTEAPFLEFMEDVKRARAEADARLVLLISKAAQDPKTWQAAAWLLERRDPARWGRTSRENAQAEKEGAKGAVQQAIDTMTGKPALPVEEG